MELILALILAQDTLEEAIQKQAAKLEDKELLEALGRRPKLEEPGKDVRRLELAYRIEEDGEELWVHLTCKRGETGWTVQARREERNAEHGETGGTKYFPGDDFSRFLELLEKKDYESLRSCFREKNSVKYDAAKAKSDIETEDRRCQGKLVESLKQLPKVARTPGAVTDIFVEVQTESMKAHVRMMKENGHWCIEDVDADLKK